MPKQSRAGDAVGSLATHVIDFDSNVKSSVLRSLGLSRGRVYFTRRKKTGLVLRNDRGDLVTAPVGLEETEGVRLRRIRPVPDIAEPAPADGPDPKFEWVLRAD